MLRVDNLGYASPATVTFQRSSVVLTELALLAIAWHVAAPAGRGVQAAALAAVALHPGLIIVDHIHFQYNGILLGTRVPSLGRGEGQVGAGSRNSSAAPAAARRPHGLGGPLPSRLASQQLPDPASVRGSGSSGRRRQGPHTDSTLSVQH